MDKSKLIDMNRRFDEKLKELVSIKKQNTQFFNTETYAKMIEKVKFSKSKVAFKKPEDYQRLRRYDVKTIDGVEKLIVPVKGNSNIMYYVSENEIFQIIHETHLKTGHIGRYRMMRELKLRYKNITRDMVIIYLNLCDNCGKRNVPKKTKKELVKSSSVSSEINARSRNIIPTKSAKCPADLRDMQPQEDGQINLKILDNELKMPLTSAERCRKYREKLKMENPVKFEELKKRNSERTKAKKKKISDMTIDERQEIRQRWREEKKQKNLLHKELVGVKIFEGHVENVLQASTSHLAIPQVEKTHGYRSQVEMQNLILKQKVKYMNLANNRLGKMPRKDRRPATSTKGKTLTSRQSDQDNSEDEYHAKSSLPNKSKERYIAVYDNFITWKNEKNITSFSEKILITYFEEISTKYKPSSLWAIYSMLKNTLKSKDNVNLEGYVKLTSFLKKQSNGYVGKKSKVLTVENVDTFIEQAPDDKYLVTKVALILGVTGGLRRQELSDITVDQIENHGEMFLVKIPSTEHKLPRTFVVQGKYYNIMKRYQNLRSKKAFSNRFFQHYRNGKCSGQVIGKNRFGNMPKEIAEFLNLPDANLYTGHTFRRTSTSLLADGGDMCSKRPGRYGNSESEHKTSTEVQERAELDSSESTRTNRPPINPLEQCCFCGEFTKMYVNIVNQPYIVENKTTLTINNLNVTLDFNEALPKTACLICDKKLQDMQDFVNLVKFAQDTLINIETRPIETVIVKNECESHDEYDDNRAEMDDNDETNSLAVCETVYENQSVNRKRQNNSVNKRKSKVSKESDATGFIIEVKTEPLEQDLAIYKQEAIEDDDSMISDLVIDIKEEPIDYYGSKENPGFSDTGTLGTEIKSSDLEFDTDALVHAMGDDNS